MRKKIPGKRGKGVIVGSWVTRGDPPTGVATEEYTEVFQAHAEEAMDSLSRQKIPTEKQDYVRDYFDAIRGEKVVTPDDE